MTQALTTKDPATLAFLRALDPNLGTEDLGSGGLNPYLTVVRNTDRAELENGEKAKMGQIYHAGLKQAWDTTEVHFVYAKMAEMYVEWDDEAKDWDRTKPKKNHLMVGGFLTNDQMTPFIYKVKGMNWSKFIDYQKQVEAFRKLYGVPMLALRTQLKTALEKNSQGGQAWVIVPNVLVVDNQPQIAPNVRDVKVYSESIPMFKKMIADAIERNVRPVERVQ